MGCLLWHWIPRPSTYGCVQEFSGGSLDTMDSCLASCTHENCERVYQRVDFAMGTSLSNMKARHEHTNRGSGYSWCEGFRRRCRSFSTAVSGRHIFKPALSRDADRSEVTCLARKAHLDREVTWMSRPCRFRLANWILTCSRGLGDVIDSVQTRRHLRVS